MEMVCWIQKINAIEVAQAIEAGVGGTTIQPDDLLVGLKPGDGVTRDDGSGRVAVEVKEGVLVVDRENDRGGSALSEQSASGKSSGAREAQDSPHLLHDLRMHLFPAPSDDKSRRTNDLC